VQVFEGTWAFTITTEMTRKNQTRMEGMKQVMVLNKKSNVLAVVTTRAAVKG